MKKLNKTSCFLTSLILCLGLCGCNSDDKDSSKVESIVETTEQETTEAPQDTIPSTQETTHNFSNEATIVQQPTEEFQADVFFITTFIQGLLEDGFNKDEITIEYDEKSNSYIAYTFREGLITSISLTDVNSKLREDWNNIVTAYTQGAQTIFEYVQACDSEANLILNLTSGKKEENTAILTVSNGEVTYDYYEHLNEQAEDSKPAYEDENVKITYTGIEESYTTDVKLTIENKSNKKIIVQARDVSVNGIMTKPIFSCNITPGKKANDSMSFYNLQDDGIDSIETIELSFHIYDSDSLDKIIDTEAITIDVSK